jgi:hypothetical protein
LLKIVRGISELPWENKKFTLEIDHETLTSLFKIQEENTKEIYTINCRRKISRNDFKIIYTL